MISSWILATIGGSPYYLPASAAEPRASDVKSTAADGVVHETAGRFIVSLPMQDVVVEFDFAACDAWRFPVEPTPTELIIKRDSLIVV